MGYALTISAIDSATKMLQIATLIHPHTAVAEPPSSYAMENVPELKRAHCQLPHPFECHDVFICELH